MEEILFTKMHGTGNDYVYINCLDVTPSRIPQLAIDMSRPHTGIGADGIILILPSDKADFKMRIFNADGSEALMCGNGSRCVGKYVWDHRLTESSDITLETLSGIKRLHLHTGAGGTVSSVTVDMGTPSTLCRDIPVNHKGQNMIDCPVQTSSGEMRLTAISMGNPHGVIFTECIDSLNLPSIGRELETHPMWPDRANIEFAQVISPNEIIMRVWERGSGETMACGTGACATAVAAAITGRCGRDVTVHLRGGDLQITHAPDGRILMTGEAATVFEGRYFHKTK